GRRGVRRLLPPARQGRAPRGASRARAAAKGVVMIPVLLDPARLKVVVVGRGEPLACRLEKLREAGASDIRVLAAPPSAASLAGVRLVFAAGLDREEATQLA